MAQQPRIGFVGIGMMGHGMAINLQERLTGLRSVER
jgi:NAD binding domain of 6-phosphogluconate dehydrogenase.